MNHQDGLNPITEAAVSRGLEDLLRVDNLPTAEIEVNHGEPNAGLTQATSSTIWIRAITLDGVEHATLDFGPMLRAVATKRSSSHAI